MRFRWEAEACDLAPDPQSGAAVTRLTSTVMSNINIYYEQPYGTPDGRRVAYLRSPSSDPRLPPNQQLCVADLDRIKVGLIDDQVQSHWVATSSWSGKVFYLRTNGELVSVDLTTLEKRIALTQWPLPPNTHLWTISPDERYLVTLLHDWQWYCNVVRVDLHDGSWRVIYRHPDVHGHVQVNHVTGREILLQRNRGMRRHHFKQSKREPVEHGGATHVFIDIDGDPDQEAREAQIGEPYTASSTGHASWVADTGRLATPVHWRHGSTDSNGETHPPAHDERHPQGNFVIASPDAPPVVFEAPEHLFNHASMSRCGRYFVADSFRNGIPGPIEIVVGNIETGRYRTLISDCGAQGGGPACSHPHPYFTADNRRVVYNADPHHVCHLHVATLPEDFLASLD